MTVFPWFRWLAVLALLSAALPAAAPAAPAVMVVVGDRDLQAVLDEAPAHAIVVCDRNRLITVDRTIEVRKPVLLRGLTAQLPRGLGGTSLLIVRAKGVALIDLELTGNGDSVPQDQRAPLVVVAAGDFRIEGARFFNSSKDGINVDGDAAGEDIVGGVIRDIVGRKVIRDTVSISGGDQKGFKVRNVLVENVRAYDSQRRGAVEVSDGSENITVRKVYAERCVYAVDVQDHSKPAQVNRHIVVEDIHAVRSKHALRTSNRPLGHTALTVRDITAEDCTDPIQISNTSDVQLENVRVRGHEGASPPIFLRNCPGAVVRDVRVERTAHTGAAVVLQDCDRALVDGFGSNASPALKSAVHFRITTGVAFSGLRITNVLAPASMPAGILLEATGEKKGTLTDYLVQGNVATVEDRIRGPRGRVQENAR